MINFWKKLPRPFTALAPMDDVTDFVFRELITRTAKPDVLFTEFTNTDALQSPAREKTLQRLIFSDKQHPIVAQVWGSTPLNFAKAAEIIQERGFDGLDINMGCPDRNVMKKMCGASLMHTWDLSGELINAVKSSVPNLAISVKTRLLEEQKTTNEWISFLLKQPINALIIHGRTVLEKSKVPANWEQIGQLVKLRDKIAPEVTIIGNGDVTTYAQVLEKHANYGVDGVMIGRGIFSNPWVFEKLIIPRIYSNQEHLALLYAHLMLEQEVWGATPTFNRRLERMKKFFKIYINNFAGADSLRQRLMVCKKYTEVIDIISNLLINS